MRLKIVKNIGLVFTFILLISGSGCATTGNLNSNSSNDITQLKVGMTQDEVVGIMGKPIGVIPSAQGVLFKYEINEKKQRSLLKDALFGAAVGAGAPMSGEMPQPSQPYYVSFDNTGHVNGYYRDENEYQRNLQAAQYQVNRQDAQMLEYSKYMQRQNEINSQPPPQYLRPLNTQKTYSIYDADGNKVGKMKEN